MGFILRQGPISCRDNPVETSVKIFDDRIELTPAMKKGRDYSWFNLADYEPRRQFDLHDWSIMLLLRDRLRNDVDRSLAFKEFNWLNGYWLNYLDEALPSKYSSNKSDDRYQQLLASDPVLEDVTHLALPDANGFRPISTFAIENTSARLLQINILAPDTILISAVKSWLRKFRKSSPLPIRRRGKPGLNLEITKDHLHSWSQYNILAVLDLDLYDKARGHKKQSNRELFEKLNPKGDRSAEEWGVEARGKAQEALGCLYPLIAQAKFPG